MSVAEVFISYSHADRPHAELIVEKLHELGVSTWMDTRLDDDGAFDIKINENLHAAQVVLVVWTPASVESAWVRGEATLGLELGKYVGAVCKGRITRVEPFDKAAPADLRTWDGDHDYSEWRYVKDAVAARLKRPIGGRMALTPEEVERRRVAGDPDGARQRQVEMIDIRQGKGTFVGAMRRLIRMVGGVLLWALFMIVLLGLFFLFLLAVGWAGNGVVGWFS